MKIPVLTLNLGHVLFGSLQEFILRVLAVVATWWWTQKDHCDSYLWNRIGAGLAPMTLPLCQQTSSLRSILSWWQDSNLPLSNKLWQDHSMLVQSNKYKERVVRQTTSTRRSQQGNRVSTQRPFDIVSSSSQLCGQRRGFIVPPLKGCLGRPVT